MSFRRMVFPLLFTLAVPCVIAHAQTTVPDPIAAPKLSRFAESLVAIPWRYYSAGIPFEDAKRVPQLYITYPPYEALHAQDWFEKNGVLLGCFYEGTYSGPPPVQLRSVVADSLLKVVAMKGMPACNWPNNVSNYQLPRAAYATPWAKRSFTTLIELLGPELAERGVTKSSAYALLDRRSNIDVVSKSHWAFLATQEMHNAGLLIGD